MYTSIKLLTELKNLGNIIFLYYYANLANKMNIQTQTPKIHIKNQTLGLRIHINLIIGV